EQLDLIDSADRLHAQPENGRAGLAAHVHQLLDVETEFVLRAVNRVALFSGKFDLTTGFDSDRGAFTPESEHASFFSLGLVTVAIRQALQDLFDATRTGEWKSGAVFGGDCDLLVLGTHAPFGARLGAC